MLAEAIAGILEGDSVEMGLLRAGERNAFGTRTKALLHQALDAAGSDTPPMEAIPKLGEGWVAEEALAIGAYCAVRAGSDLRVGLRWAVNHSGDSDSTGSVCGNLIGAAFGTACLPEPWLEALELCEVIAQVARDMVEVRTSDPEAFWDRYPGC